MNSTVFRVPYLYGAAVWLFYSLIGVGVSVGIGSIVLFATGKEISIAVFTNGGQFALSSATMFTTTYYQVLKPNSFRLPGTEWLGIACFVGAIVAVTFFVLAMSFSQGAQTRVEVIQWPTIGLFIGAACLAFVAVTLDNRRSDPDFTAAKAAEVRALDDSFDKTQ
jgi:hypothetical protein